MTDVIKIDDAALQSKIAESALKGATQAIEEFFTGYNSPFKKAIEQQLRNAPLNGNIELPDIVALINANLTNEIDKMANTAVAKTFIPLVTDFLVREKKDIKFSDFLSKFITTTEVGYDDASILIEKDAHYGWISLTMRTAETTYKLTLHEEWGTKYLPELEKKYKFLSLPSSVSDSKYLRTMKISLDGATLEMPFCQDVLKDGFVSYVARLVLCNTTITMDVDDFDENMFENDEKCHCH